MLVICSKKNLSKTLQEIKENGFDFVNGEPTVSEIIKNLPNVKYFGFNCFYNYLTKKNEAQFESLAWYKKHNKI